MPKSSNRDSVTGRIHEALEARAPIPANLQGASGKGAKTSPRTIRFPKDSTALRNYAAAKGAANTAPRFRLAPVKTKSAERPRASEELRLRLEELRRVATGSTSQRAERALPAAPFQIQSPSDVGRLIRSKREAAGLTQGQLALAAGTGRRFISELEAGKPTAELGRVLAVCRALGVDLVAGA